MRGAVEALCLEGETLEAMLVRVASGVECAMVTSEWYPGGMVELATLEDATGVTVGAWVEAFQRHVDVGALEVCYGLGGDTALAWPT